MTIEEIVEARLDLDDIEYAATPFGGDSRTLDQAIADEYEEGLF